MPHEKINSHSMSGKIGKVPQKLPKTGSNLKGTKVRRYHKSTTKFPVVNHSDKYLVLTYEAIMNK